MSLFKVVFYTKGYFVKELNLRYESEDIYGYTGQDNDYWSLFKARDLIKIIDSTFNVDGVKMWWKQEGGSLEKYLKPFSNDDDASLLCLFAKKNECEVQIYTEANHLQVN